MHIQTIAENMIMQWDPLTARVEAIVKETLGAFTNQISIVVVRLGDSNHYRNSSGDHRCLMEARIEGRPWIATSAHGESQYQAICSAVEKLKKSVEDMLMRSNNNVLA